MNEHHALYYFYLGMMAAQALGGMPYVATRAQGNQIKRLAIAEGGVTPPPKRTREHHTIRSARILGTYKGR